MQHVPTHRTQAFTHSLDMLSLVQIRKTPTLPEGHPLTHTYTYTLGHTAGPAYISPPPSPKSQAWRRLCPAAWRHMWFQLARERAFPSQTARPCQGPGPTGAPHEGPPRPPLLHWPSRGPRDPSPLEHPALLFRGLPSPGARVRTRSRRARLCPDSGHGCPPTSSLLLCLQQAERDGRRAGCQGGGREGGEGACGNETLITEPLLFPSIWDISYILKTLAVYIFKGSG